MLSAKSWSPRQSCRLRGEVAFALGEITTSGGKKRAPPTGHTVEGGGSLFLKTFNMQRVESPLLRCFDRDAKSPTSRNQEFGRGLYGNAGHRNQLW